MRALVLFVLLGAGSVAGAQQSPPAPTTGSRIRIEAPRFGREPLEAVLVSVTSDSITVERPPVFRERNRPDTVAVARAAVTQLETYVGTHHNAGTGAIVGGLTGAVLGGVLGAAFHGIFCAPDSWTCAVVPSGHSMVLTGVAGGGAAGVVGGALIGLLWTSDTWSSVKVTSLGALRVVPRANGVEARLSITFP